MRQVLGKRVVGVSIVMLVVSGMGWAGYVTRQRWLPSVVPGSRSRTEIDSEAPPVDEPRILRLSSQARKNLGLVTQPLRLQSYWRSIQIPGVIVDRPGISDRGVTSPAVGVVTQVHAFAGDTVPPGAPLFTLRLFSEYLQNTQSELFKATRESELIKEERARLASAAENGAVPARRLIELDQQIRRQDGLIQAYRQDLLTRGLTPGQIEQISGGQFVSTIQVAAPPFVERSVNSPQPPATLSPISQIVGDSGVYEVQELQVELGQQVQAGQLLSVLSNHQSLYIEGHAFKQEASNLEAAAQRRWPVEVEFVEDDNSAWPEVEQQFLIRHLSNTIDPSSRTFDFYVPFENQSRQYEGDGQTFIVWRFRPGQRVRLQVPVERFENVIVLPADALAREGPEAFIFRQNGDLFNRIPVQVLHQDRRHVVIANGEGLALGSFVAQNSAASLNRVLKAQAASGIRADVHVHADGTVHGAH